MAPVAVTRAGPIRTAKTPKRVRFAGEDRDQTRLIRQLEAEKRDARSLPRVDVDVTTSYELPVVSAAAEALFSYVKSTAESAKSTLGSTLGSMVEYGRSALTQSFTSSFGRMGLGLNSDKDQRPQTSQQQASMLEYPPFLAGATPNVVKKNRRDYYQSIGVTSSMQKAKSYAPDTTSTSTPARTPQHMQSEKEKIWYRFHETPYAGHKLDFGRGRTSLPPPSRPEYRFESPTRNGSKRKTPKSSKASAKRSAMKKRSKPKLGEVAPRQSNSEEFHANFSGRERNELYASYTRFLTAIRFDVKQFATQLRDLRLPTDTILKIYENMKRSDWDFFIRIMADEEYWGQVKGVGSTKVPTIPNYVESPPTRTNVFPCDYCKPYEWAGKPETREIENEGDEVPVRGHTKFDEPYTREEQAHIDAGRFYKVFHRFCHESRYDWIFADPSRPCTWEGQGHPDAKDMPWSITKYDPRLRHFPLLMQRIPKRVRQIQQDLHDMVRSLTAQDRAAWLYIQGIRRHNTRMATLLEKMDLERKRRQVLWPCQMQVNIHIKNKPEPELKPQPEPEPEEPVQAPNKRIHHIEMADDDEPETEQNPSKRSRFRIGSREESMGNGTYRRPTVEDESKTKDDSIKRTRSEDIDMESMHKDKRAHTEKLRNRTTPPGSFGLFFYDEEDTEDDEKTEKERGEGEKLVNKENDKITVLSAPKEPEQPKLTWLQKLDATMKLREAELAAQEAERAKAEAEKAAAKPPAPQSTEESIPSILSNKPVFPAAPTTAPPAAPHKTIVFEDPSPTQEQTQPTQDGRNPLMEHTNGVKPVTNVPNLFGSAVPNLAPTGFTLNQNNVFSPLKSGVTAAPTVFGSNKTGGTSRSGNEENIPNATAAAQAPALAPTGPPAAPPAPSLFAPKPPTTTAPTAAPSAFNFNTATSAAAPTNTLFSAPSAAPAVTENNKPAFFFGKPAEPKKNVEADAAPKAPTPSIFSAIPAASAAPTSFTFGGTTAPTATAPSIFSKAPEAVPAVPSIFQKPLEAAPAAPSIFQKPLEAAPTNMFAKAAENSKPAEPVSSNIFSKPAEKAPIANIFGNIGGVSAVPVVTTASTTSGLFGKASTEPSVATSAAPTLGLFGPSSAPTASAPSSAATVGLFGTTSTAPTTAAATTTSGLFGAIPAPAPVEAPNTSFLFGSATASAPSVDFGSKPAAPTQFNFTSGAKSTPQFSFSGTKPAEPVAPTAPAPTSFSFSGNPATSAAPSTQFSFSGATSSGTTTPSIFTSAAPATTTASALTTSFPTSNSFVFGANNAAPTASVSQSFPPGTPQAQPPSVVFGGFKGQGQDSPIKANSPGNKFNEDISMASPEQSPEKPSHKPGIFGNATSGIGNGVSTGNLFGQKSFFQNTAPAVPSSLKFNFGGNPQSTSAAPSTSFGATVSQPAVSMPSATASLPSAPGSFQFNGFAGIPGAPSPASTMTTPPAAAPAQSTFQFDTGGVDFSLQATSSTRKFATPRRRGGKR